MRLFVAEICESAVSDCPPRTSAPIDDGSDAAVVTQRLLLATPDLGEINIRVLSVAGALAWRGSVVKARQPQRLVELRGVGLFAQLDCSTSLAVSYCANRSAGGVCIFGHEGDHFKLWSTHRCAFDAWLERAVPGLGRRGLSLVS